MFLRNDAKWADAIDQEKLSGKIVWIGGGGLSHLETQELGPELEKGLGHPIPLKESNNPFEYQEDLEIRITKFLLGTIPTEKAKAPYSPDIYYRMYFPDLTIVIVNSYMNIPDAEWLRTLESPLHLPRDVFQRAVKLVEAYEKETVHIPQ